jgi:tetratricopeptide (TPR) repeat protein
MLTGRLITSLLAGACGLLGAGRASPVRAPKAEAWLEVRSPNFTVVTTHDDKRARGVAEQFELFRAVAQRLLPKADFDLGRPLFILAVKNEKALQELLPEYWEQKGRMHPAGVFVGGEEKLYIALRTDVTGDFPYQVIYHEYVHALLRRNFENIPLWLNEGFAELLAHSVLGNKEASVGRPSEGHLYWLQSNKLLPLEVLLTVDHSSPHYNEANRTTAFYAQSWALTHYFFLGTPAGGEDLLGKYFRELDTGAAEKDAAQAAFGNLKTFARTFDSYIRQGTFKAWRVPQPPDSDEKRFEVRPLSAAQSAALRGDFHVHMNRPAEARTLLAEALAADPHNAQAHESMGLLALRQQDHTHAGEWFAKAAALDSRSYLAHYYAAMLHLKQAANDDHFAETEASLKRALELNPSFAPACSTLASLYSMQDERLDQALLLAQKAVRLQPGSLSYRINLASVLMRMKRVDEAILIGEKARAAAKDAGEQAMAESFLRSAREYNESLARLEAARKDAEERAARRAREQSEYEAALARRRDEEARARELQLKPGEALAFGLIAEVTCTGPEAMNVILLSGSSSLPLRAARRSAISYRIGIGKVAHIDPCKELSGQQAQVIYRAGASKTTPGELVSIEMLDAPVVTEPAPSRAAGRKASAAKQNAESPGGDAAAVPAGRSGWSEGKVTGVSCNGAELTMTLSLGGGFSTRLHSSNYHKVAFLAAPGVILPDQFQPCTQLRGRNAEVKYFVAEGKGYNGEIVSIEIRP